MAKSIKRSWESLIKQERSESYFNELITDVLTDYENRSVFPPLQDLFNAFKYFEVSETKVVILGQEPYTHPGQAHGLAFSVSPSCEDLPPTLRNIFKEIKNDTNNPQYKPENGSLERWAEQGVLLLNTILTVQEGRTLSHKNVGWEIFTNVLIRKMSMLSRNSVFMLWGNKAQAKLPLIETSNGHLVLVSPRPSPSSANKGFFGSKQFTKCNEFLTNQGKSPIIW